MKIVCRVFFWLFIASYLFAIFVYLTGVFGWFNTESDPLSGIFLIILGQPWITLSALLPESLLLFTGIIAPVLNAAIIFVICRTFNRSKG